MYMKRINRTYWIIALAFILLAAGGYAAYRFWYLPTQIVENKDSTLQTAVARRGDIILYAAGAGELIPSAEVDVSFDISDNIQEELVELLVEVGDVVEQGDILARLDDSDRQEKLLLAQRQLRELSSPSAIAALEIELAKTKINLQDEVDDLVGLISLRVYNAEKNLKANSDELRAAQAAYDQDPSEENQAILTDAEQNLSRAESGLAAQWDYYQRVYLPEYFEYSYRDDTNKVVYYINAPSELEISSARAKVDLSEATIVELEVLLDSLKSGEDLPEEATGSQVSSIRQARQAVKDALEDLEATNLIAPIAGTITKINLNVSEKVGNEVVMVISDLTPPTLDAYFDESDWKNVQEGFPVEVTFDALPDSVYVGQVVHVNPGLVKQNNTSVVYAMIELDISVTDWGDLPVGSAAGVDVIGGRAENAILVPIEALREISEGEYAVFVMEDGEPHMQLVEVGLQDFIYAEILSGLKQGDVVTTGQVETAQ
jgi:multidrug efflux pump subunit AcrA (membrane-fusion protein)